jgi:hypothetical protein
MSGRRCNSRTFAAAALLFGVLVSSAGFAAPASEQKRPPADRYQRADAATVKAEAEKVLADPRYAPRWSFWRWLREKLSHWSLPDFHVPAGLSTVIIWLLLIWCVLTLVAILAHVIWTFVVLKRSRTAGGEVSLPQAAPQFGEGLTYDELVAGMREAASRGQFRRALAFMMLALLRRLDEAGTVRFHRSKTNGEYVREYPPAAGGRDEFRKFTRGFDAVVYGGRPCGERGWQEMMNLFDRIHPNVRKGP